MQIRDVPEDVRDRIAELAAARGQSTQAFLLELLRREVRIAANAAVFERTARERVILPDEASPERIVREGRDRGFAVDRVDPA